MEDMKKKLLRHQAQEPNLQTFSWEARNRLINFCDGSLKWLQIMPQLKCHDNLILTTDDYQ